MSWSVSGIGKPVALAEKFRKDFAAMSPCSLPEETVRLNIAASIDPILYAYPPNLVVKVEANGSQFTPDNKKPDERINFVNLKIENWGRLVE